MHPSFWREIWILFWIALASLLFGLISDRYFIAAAIGFGIYIAVQIRHLNSLHRWLLNRTQVEIPEAEGLWGDVFNEIRKLMKQTERRQDQLAGMVERFQSAASAMPDAVVIVTERDEIEWANRAAGRLFGIHYPSDHGMRLGNLLRDPEFARYLAIAEYAEPLEMASPNQPDSTVAIQIIPFGARQKLILARDITRLQRLEQMRRHFVANVSHELRTPITVLSGFVETLLSQPQVRAEELRKHLTTMQNQSLRMQRLVDDLLTLSKLETAPPHRREETIDVPALLNAIKEQAEIISGDNKHRITLEADVGLKLLGSREELQSAFSNLVNNAVRYTPSGGDIRLLWWQQDNSAYFAVTDTGEGIAREHLPYLTERFYRVDSARSRASGGTGLGLSIVKHVLLRHDAQLTIDSEPGKGSTFTCVFPAARVVRAEASSARA
ncbi:MAG: phosphate regulon sensor histidine kinase PhoR [Pseudomonadota bacterium]|nr:MAG: phosphate regulon sensor histidine kinase PhoR [Pseudomonadota bacterium]